MRSLGLIGGTGWLATADYYKRINIGVNAELGGLNFVNCHIHSFNFAVIKLHIDAGDWDAILNLCVAAGTNLRDSGAQAILLCANTLHIVADSLEKSLGIPVIHIATETARVISEAKLKKVALLGTKPTMQLDFFKDKLLAKGIETILPTEKDQEIVHQSIFEELGKGLFKAETKSYYLKLIDQLISEGAEAIVLGCTDYQSLITAEDVSVPLFDTTKIHAAAAVAFALGKS